MGLIPFRCSWRIWRSKASHTWHHLHPMPWESRAHFTLQTLTVYHCHLMLSVQHFFQLNFIYFKMEKRWFIRGTSHNLLKSTDELTDIFTGSGFIALPQVVAFLQIATSQPSKSCLTMPTPPPYPYPQHLCNLEYFYLTSAGVSCAQQTKPSCHKHSFQLHPGNKQNLFHFQVKNSGQFSDKRLDS